jgi:transcription antitermination factor NusG
MLDTTTKDLPRMAITAPDGQDRLSADSCGSRVWLPSHQQRWYCGLTKPGKQRDVTNKLLELGFSAHLPLFMDYRPGRPAVIKPLFGRYFFVSLDLRAAHWRKARHVRGVASIFSDASGERPIPIAEGIVEELIARGRALDGVIDTRAPEFEPLLPGQPVTILSGFLEGRPAIHEMTVKGRVALVAEILGASRRIWMKRAQVR